MNFQQLGEHLLLLLAGNNGVHKAVLYLKFCPLEAAGQLFADGLLNDAGTGKADQRTRARRG